MLRFIIKVSRTIVQNGRQILVPYYGVFRTQAIKNNLMNHQTRSNFFQLYEDSKACVLTREYLEAEQTELEEDFAVPVTIICLVGGLGKPTLS